jgi:thiamine transporter ThiT
MFYSPSWNNFMIELPTFIFYYLCQGLIFLFLVYFIKFQLSISIGIKQYILFGFLGGLLGLILGIGYALRDMKVLIEFLIRSISLSFIPGFVWLWTYNTLSKKIKNSV